MARRNQVLFPPALAATSIVADAQYPDRPPRLVIPFLSGGGPVNGAGHYPILNREEREGQFRLRKRFSHREGRKGKQSTTNYKN